MTDAKKSGTPTAGDPLQGDRDNSPARGKNAARSAGSIQQTSGASAPTARSSNQDVSAFLAKARQMAPVAKGAGAARLVFAMDATMSRQPTWDLALTLQSDMFAAVKEIGGLDVQLVYFRGYGECRASKWASDPDTLAQLMSTVSCRGGRTQIRKVLTHARRENERGRIHAMVYVGDAMEENIDELSHLAGELGLLGVPVFTFQEGHDPMAERSFREIARLTRGAWCRFDAGSAAQLRALLSAVAVYVTGGRKALSDLGRRESNAQRLLEQLR